MPMIRLKPGSILQFNHEPWHKNTHWAVETPNPRNIKSISPNDLDGHLAEVVDYFGEDDAVYVPHLEIYICGICTTSVFKIVHEIV